MAKAYSQIMQDPSLTPEWLVEGTTNLLPKKEETWIPKNYRPIACLPKTFKILASVIMDRLYDQLEKESIMTPEQRGGRKDCYGCKGQLMINNAILENCKRGIFQGDSLSPLLFTISLNPLSWELQKTGYGYQLDKQTKISHLFYVDNLKLYGTSDNQLNGLISTVKKVSDDIQMEFGLDKCAKATFKRGKKASAECILLNDHQLIQDLDQAETYKYLGMDEGEGVQHQQMKIKIKKENKWQIKLVVNSELNARNRIAAINTLAVPVVLYSYEIIDWKLNEIQDLDKMTRKQLCINRMLAKKADVDQESGRSLMNLEKEYKATMVGLHKYMMNKEDSQIQAVLRHQTAKALHSIPKEAEAYLTEAGKKDLITNDLPKSATWKAKKLKLKYKEDINKLVRDRWKEKAMHGKLSKYLEKDHVDQEMSFQCMKYTGLKGETEGLITAAQDQALNTRYYTKHIIKQGSTDRCRMCHTQVETVEHIISGCQTLAADKYLNRHNQVAAQLHLDICKHYAIKVDAQHWYQHNPERVMENEKATILWDHQVKTDRHIPCNKPDIIIQEKDSERCLIIDVAIPSDCNIQKNATEKMSKYVDLQIECQRMWNKKVEVIPIIIGATGIVKKGIQSYLQKIPCKHNLYNLQRSAILGTAHILRKVLSIKPD